MASSIYVFNRLLHGEEEHLYAQTVSVFAPDLGTARRLLVEDLARLRADGDREDQILQPEPDWDVSSILLDEPKVITFAVT